MKPKLLITIELAEIALQKLKEYFEVHVNLEDRDIDYEELKELVEDKDLIICSLGNKIDEEVIKAGSNLKGIVNYAVGFNNIDIDYATKKSIPVTNTPGVLTETTADLAWSLLMAIARKIPESDKFVRDRKFKRWSSTLMLGGDIYGKTLGIVGAGRIGTATAMRSKGFNMDVLYCNRSKNSQLEGELNAKKVDLDTLLKESDFVSLHLPLFPETKHLITLRELEMMKKTAYIINTARGPIIRETDLLHALKNKIIKGAGLDVFEFEPKIEEGLFTCDNVVMAPHIGSASIETRTNMAMMCADNAIKIIEGKRPPQLLNREIWK